MILEIIGRGERATILIVQELHEVTEKRHKFYDFEAGIYTQIPVTSIFSEDTLTDLSDFHKKSSVDVLVHTKDNKLIAYRVQDGHHRGDLKGGRDEIQRKNLYYRINYVVDLHENECAQLFKEKVNESTKNYVKEQLETEIKSRDKPKKSFL